MKFYEVVDPKFYEVENGKKYLIKGTQPDSIFPPGKFKGPLLVVKLDASPSEPPQ